MKQRLEYVDAIKGVAIILMVIGHAIAWNYSDYRTICIFDYNQPINIKIGGAIWQIIYSFHMSLFFIVSGFLTYKSFKFKDSVCFIKKKIVRLLIPWVCTMWIVYLVRGVVGYWFLICLFELSIVGFILICIMQKINNKNYLYIDLIIIFFSYMIMRYFHVQNWSFFEVKIGQFVGALLPFSVGILLRKYKFLFSICMEMSWFYTVSFLLFGITFSSRYLLDYSVIFRIVYHHSSVVLSVIGSLLVFHSLYKGAFSRIRTVLSYMGVLTLPIYILHIMFVIQIPEIGDYILKQNAITSIVLQLCYSIFISAIAIMLSLILYRIIIVSPLLRYLFFGE